MGQLFALSALVLFALPGEDAYRAAKIAEAKEEYASALQAFESAADVSPELAPFARIRAAVCRANLGDSATAAGELERLLRTEAGQPWTALARHELALIRQATGDYSGAARHFDAAHRFSNEVWWLEDVRMQGAINLLQVPQLREDGLRFYRRLVESPWPHKRLAAARILADTEDTGDRLLGVLGLIRSGKPKDASNVLEALQVDPERDPMRRYVVARLLLAQDKLAEGRAALASLAQDFPDESVATRALRDLIDSHLAKREFDDAFRVWTRLSALAPNTTHSVRSRGSIASRNFRSERWADAIAHYRWIVDNASDSATIANAELQLGRAFIKIGDTPFALAAYERVANQAPSDASTIEAGFRAGELHRRAGRMEQAIKRYASAAKYGITRYYGYRAQQRLAELGDAPAQSHPPLPTSPSTTLVRPLAVDTHPADSSPAASDRLQFFGREGYEEAEWEALHIAASAQNSDGSQFLAIGSAGVAYTAMQIANARAFRENPDGTQSIERLRIRYPRVHWDLVQEVAAEHGLHPHLILSICRQESTFRPNLESSAGARGIMQMMPATANALADKEALLDVTRLDHPPTSIRLGSRYLREMIDRYDGNLVFALAAYNAGPANCDRWRSDLDTTDLAEFIESIPYAETRSYVRRVLAHYATYESIYPDDR